MLSRGRCAYPPLGAGDERRVVLVRCNALKPELKSW